MSAAPETSRERVLFLGGHRKGGTTMFLNLFDGHGACCVFPTDISVLYGYFPVYTEGDYTADERVDRLDLVVFRTLQRLRSRYDLGALLPVEAMREHFFDALDRTRLDRIGVVIRQIVDSFRVAVGMRVSDRPVMVIKETSLEIHARYLAGLFPGARFVQLLRDPRDNYGALRSGVDKHYRLFDENEAHLLASLLHRAGLGMQLVDANVAALGPDHFTCVRFESLVADPEGVMRDVAAFADINFETALTRPTIMGLPTSGNNYDDEQFFEVTARNVGRWRERVRDVDAQVIEFHLGDLMEQFDYPCAFPPEARAEAAAAFYRWTNYRYFYKDSFKVV